MNREIVEALLEPAGIRLDTAVDGSEALERAHEADYALILMDIQMPVMDGETAARAIRALPRHAGTPIVALTANAFDESRRACLAAGMDDFLVKPIEPDLLFGLLLAWIGRRSSARPEPQTAADPTAAGR